MKSTAKTRAARTDKPSLTEAAKEFVEIVHSQIPEGLESEKADKLSACVETITPAIAERYLLANVKNRDLRPTTVIKYAGDMSRGSYVCTSDGVGFDVNGYLVNGQHRLSGVMVSGVTVDMVVVRGLSTKAQDVTDHVLRRTLADALKLRNERYIHMQAAALQWTYRFAYIAETGVPHYTNAGQRPTVSQLLEVWEANPEMRELPRLVMRLHQQMPAYRTGLLVAVWYRLRQVDVDDADLFVSKLMSGANLESNDPIFLLRRMLLQDRSRHYNLRMQDWREAALTIKAWNFWREQKPVSQLSYHYGPSQRDKFPLPV